MSQPVRTFHALRHGVPKPESNVEPIERVIRRVFNSGDGLRVLAWMIAETHGPSPYNADDRTLREAEGARRFVSKLNATVDDPSAE